MAGNDDQEKHYRPTPWRIRLRLLGSSLNDYARRRLAQLDRWLSGLSSSLRIILLFIVWLFVRGVSPRWLQVDLSVAVIGILVALATLRSAFSKSLRQKVFAIAVVYVAIMLVFGMVYHILFHYAPEDSFVFADSIREGKAHQVFMNHYNEVLRLNDSLYLLSVMDSEPQKSFEILRNKHASNPLILSSDDYLEPLTNGCSVRFLIVADALGPTVNGVYIDMRGPSKRVLLGGPYAHDTPSDIDLHVHAVKRVLEAKTVEDFVGAERSLQAEIVQERSDAISELRANANRQTSWDYLDFCYFSAMTMTTVGYGDILPSSRLSRGVVLFHAVLSIFYIGFALSIVWPHS